MFEFDFILGGVVMLNCTISTQFGDALADSLRVTYDGKPFDCGGIVIDYDGEFLPVSEYLVAFARNEIKRNKSTLEDTHGHTTAI